MKKPLEVRGSLSTNSLRGQWKYIPKYTEYKQFHHKFTLHTFPKKQKDESNLSNTLGTSKSKMLQNSGFWKSRSIQNSGFCDERMIVLEEETVCQICTADSVYLHNISQRYVASERVLW